MWTWFWFPVRLPGIWFSLVHSPTPGGAHSWRRNSLNSAKCHIKHRFELFLFLFFLTFYSDKFPPCPRVVSPALPLRQPLVCFLQAGLFWTFRRTGVIGHVVLWVSFLGPSTQFSGSSALEHVFLVHSVVHLDPAFFFFFFHSPVHR